MKQLLAFFLFTFYVISASALELSVEAGSFKGEGKTYLETYIRVLGNSAKFIKLEGGNGLMQAALEFTIIIRDKDQIVSFEKYTLISPQVESSQDFLDVKRFAIPHGRYTLEISAKDINDEKNNLELKTTIRIDEYSGPIDISDIQLFGKVEKADQSNPLAKNGLFMEPLSYGLVTEDINTLNIYTEIYKSTLSQDPIFLKYAIFEDFEGGQEVMKKVKKLNDVEYEPLLLQLPVDKVASGSYRLEIELFDKTKTVLSSKSTNFRRTNVAYDLEYWQNYNREDENSFVSDMTKGEVNYGLRASVPVIFEPKKGLINFIVKEASLKAQKRFLFDIWKDKEPNNTEFHYREYLKFAKAVDIEYTNNVGFGFETDRGYVFLRYGKPNNVQSVDQEVDAYPYEIWYYNFVKETNQTNVRFLFYNKSLVHKDFSLLHTTCRGERQDPQWEIELYRRGLDTPGQSTIDAREAGDGWNRRAKQYFNEY